MWETVSQCSIAVALSHSSSKGSIHIQDRNPALQPEIDPQYVLTEQNGCRDALSRSPRRECNVSKQTLGEQDPLEGLSQRQIWTCKISDSGKDISVLTPVRSTILAGRLLWDRWSTSGWRSLVFGVLGLWMQVSFLHMYLETLQPLCTRSPRRRPISSRAIGKSDRSSSAPSPTSTLPATYL